MLTGEFKESYEKKNGNTVFVYSVIGNEDEVNDYRMTKGINYREEKGLPLYFTPFYMSKNVVFKKTIHTDQYYAINTEIETYILKLKHIGLNYFKILCEEDKDDNWLKAEKNSQLEKKNQKKNLATDANNERKQITKTITNEPTSILDVLYNEIEFSTRLISIYYPFTSIEIEEYWDVLIKGDAHYSVFLSNHEMIYAPELGLCFNKNVIWTEELKSKWKWGFDNPYEGYLEGTGGEPIEFDDVEKLKNIIPLSLIIEIEVNNNCIVSHWSSCLAPFQDIDDNNFGPNLIEKEKYSKVFPKLSFEELYEIYKNINGLILCNESIWTNTLKDILTKEEVDKIFKQRRINMLIFQEQEKLKTENNNGINNKKLASENDYEGDNNFGSSNEKYGGYNGWDDDTIDDAFDRDPENTWNVD